MEIIPSIDLREGKVVRLHQGDYAQQTTYADDPLAVAQGFVQAGATRVHVVDLDGALRGQPAHLETIEAIARLIGVPIQVGGGLRNAASIADVLAAGAERIILGTAAVLQPKVVGDAIAAHGAERIVVGLDARDGNVAISGWRQGTTLPATSLLTDMAALGVQRFVYTDISRDGTLSSPNFDAVAAMVAHASGLAAGGACVIASGGIGTVEHLRRLAGLGVEGAIVGSAIYRGTVDLAEAIKSLAQ